MYLNLTHSICTISTTEHLVGAWFYMYPYIVHPYKYATSRGNNNFYLKKNVKNKDVANKLFITSYDSASCKELKIRKNFLCFLGKMTKNRINLAFSEKYVRNTK